MWSASAYSSGIKWVRKRLYKVVVINLVLRNVNSKGVDEGAAELLDFFISLPVVSLLGESMYHKKLTKRGEEFAHQLCSIARQQVVR